MNKKLATQDIADFLDLSPSQRRSRSATTANSAPRPPSANGGGRGGSGSGGGGSASDTNRVSSSVPSAFGARAAPLAAAPAAAARNGRGKSDGGGGGSSRTVLWVAIGCVVGAIVIAALVTLCLKLSTSCYEKLCCCCCCGEGRHELDKTSRGDGLGSLMTASSSRDGGVGRPSRVRACGVVVIVLPLLFADGFLRSSGRKLVVLQLVWSGVAAAEQRSAAPLMWRIDVAQCRARLYSMCRT